MAQDYAELDTLDSTTPTIEQINTNLEALRSQFSGGSPPASPVEGQHYFQAGTLWEYTHDGSLWRPTAAYTVVSDVVNTPTTSGTAEESLGIYTMPANYIPASGNGVEIEMWFRTASNANRKRAKIKFGATVVADSGEVTLNDKLLRLVARVFRTGTSTQIAAGWASNIDPPEAVYSTPAEDMTDTIDVEARGETADSAGDLTRVLFAIRPIFGHSG